MLKSTHMRSPVLKAALIAGFFISLLYITFHGRITWQPDARVNSPAILEPPQQLDVAKPDSSQPPAKVPYLPSEEALSADIASAAPTVTATTGTLAPSEDHSRLSPQNPYSVVNLTKTQYRRTLVIAKTSAQDTSWIQTELSDILEPQQPLDTAIYVTDDKNATLHPPMDKGHEAMVYLSYVIDFYDQLPDVAIFMHFHRDARHNNDLMDMSASQFVRRLSSEKVIREGYMNLRCNWEPGCPNWIHTRSKHVDDHKSEEHQFASVFPELWPNEPMPSVFSQPCCGQFAVSGQRMRMVPKQTYVHLRNWLENTDLDDGESGRIFEYSWQYLFTGDPIYCHNTHICYCDGFSICFEDEHSYVQYTDYQDTYRFLREDLSEWEKQAEAASLGDGDPPEEGRDEHLRTGMEIIQQEMRRRKDIAMHLGNDLTKKYEILTNAWNELYEHPPGHLAEKYGHFGVDSVISPSEPWIRG